MGLVTLFGAKIPIFPICCHLHKDDNSYVEYSSDDRNMYDIEIHGWSRFEFFELCPLSENVKTLEDMFCPQSFCLVKSHCGKDLWPKLV